MRTDCTSTQLAFEGLGRRAVVGRFDGGRLTTDGGVLLLREVDRRFRVTSRLAACFRDHPRRIEHRLEPWLAKALHKSRRRGAATGRAARRFREWRYRTLTSWSRARRVVGKAEWLPGLRGANPRFVVTNIPARTLGAQALYEDLYCARGDMENRIREQQLWRFADRASSATMRANQLRLTFSAFAGALLTLLRQVGLQGTAPARARADTIRARADTIRARLLKVAARITVTVRRIRVAFPSGYPLQELFAHVLAALRAPPARAEPG